ncbi:hypothetical protein ACJX0J_027020, partial [Zea mays]
MSMLAIARRVHTNAADTAIFMRIIFAHHFTQVCTALLLRKQIMFLLDLSVSSARVHVARELAGQALETVSEHKDKIMEKIWSLFFLPCFNYLININVILAHGAAHDVSLPKSKYEEDVFINNHTSVWGSWWKDHQWGYKCCKQTIKNSYCTGLAGIEAAEASADLMKANMARKEAAEDEPVQHEEKRLATWGTDVPQDLVLNEKKLQESLKK